jgi:hypothetical protein
VMMQSEQNLCKHSLVVMVFFNMSRHMGHMSSLWRLLGETAISVLSVIASWGVRCSSYSDNSHDLLAPDASTDAMFILDLLLPQDNTRNLSSFKCTTSWVCLGLISVSFKLHCFTRTRGKNLLEMCVRAWFLILFAAHRKRKMCWRIFDDID